jgi:hypothetical protein
MMVVIMSIDTRCIVRDTRKQKEFDIFDRRTLPLPALRDSIRQQLKAQSQERQRDSLRGLSFS